MYTITQLQNVPLYAIFFDLQKAFDTDKRPALWIMLAKLGCPDSFIYVVRQLHDDMMGCVTTSGTLSDQFDINTGLCIGTTALLHLLLIFYTGNYFILLLWCLHPFLYWRQAVQPQSTLGKIKSTSAFDSGTALCRWFCLLCIICIWHIADVTSHICHICGWTCLPC